MSEAQRTRRKRLGAWYTPPELVRAIVSEAVFPEARSVLDPACGDGRFLTASGLDEVLGVDIDPQASLTKWFAERARVKDAVPIELRCVGGWRVQGEVEQPGQPGHRGVAPRVAEQPRHFRARGVHRHERGVAAHVVAGLQVPAGHAVDVDARQRAAAERLGELDMRA